MTTARLPIFPLNSVLFPGLLLPLNVFEQRYRAMMRDLDALPEEEPRRFGVVAIRDGHEVAPTLPGLPTGSLPEPGPASGFGADPLASFYSVGCAADAATVRERPDGTYEVLATGTTRFRLLSLDTSGPYLTGEVEYLEEERGEGAGALASGVVRAFRAYQKRLAGAAESTLAGRAELPAEPSVLSYVVAAAAMLDTPARQRLLQAPDTASRLAEELRVLRAETALIGKLPSLPAVGLTQRPTSPN
ncbi:LON peptidase substrate-binding domain-containing protein [Streptomyces albireticuli]|uniref:ATP-dependent protease n=1 Tax=Streptomyces albireticuli TaxID=1940 RepID=A0A2A2D5B7_9ACTN|nr:LON peptidase substrate-binding domain-containing protein [Streptomyces albireticuli]MCD9142181.1 LON peptidase substrate-binding domain-containing protein [Streptomyces albireticuli]MCD9162565.1 LON peptidase substrate-binding domain-containing protein [Streptomyces albireticuli]MCD9190355.1 LON peptidase substrate-binding domain-containing protein [Streptomyces albireticuli]PAU46579.1 ATP-dependent protease [Streptomyces albireticuli]